MNTIRDAGITGDFKHTSLKDPGAEIRLIYVEPSDDMKDEIHCRTSTYRLDCPPSYAAISYTWGDMICMRSITLNGKQLIIGENSHLVLQQVRLHRLPLPLWIDALSIDQQNDDEKSMQVSMMGAIYEKAKFTCVSLGAQQDDSELLAEQILAHADHIEHMRERTARPQPDSPTCNACGSLSTPRMYRCKECGDSMTFCVACKKTHSDQTGHYVYLNVHTDSTFRSLCVRCEQPLSMRWYQPKDDPEGRLKKVCEQCSRSHLIGTSVSSWDCEYAYMNEWEHMTRPRDFDKWNQDVLQTATRLYDLSLGTHQRIIDAFRLLSTRPYFSRLWVVHEIANSKFVVMVCGESLFHFWKLVAIAHDLSGNRLPKDEVYQPRWHDLQWRPASWYLRQFIEWADHDLNSPIWDLVDTFHASHCSDPRDRVFGLLPLADSVSQQVFRPDYTKSALDVLLQLLYCKAEIDTESGWRSASDLKYSFTAAHIIIGSFGMGPETRGIAEMRQQRTVATHVIDLCPGTPVMSYQRPPVFLEDESRPNKKRQDLFAEAEDPRQITLGVHSHCMIAQDDAGDFVAPLSRHNSTRRATYLDQIGQGIAGRATTIRALDGSVLGLTKKDVRHGDTLLLFYNGTSGAVFHSGLIVRRCAYRSGGDEAAEIIAQCIVESDVEVRRDQNCACEGHDPLMHYFDRGNETWKVQMSPEDLLLFIAHDLKLAHRDPKKFEVPMVHVLVQLEESCKRLETSVTRGRFSSFAIVERLD